MDEETNGFNSKASIAFWQIWAIFQYIHLSSYPLVLSFLLFLIPFPKISFSAGPEATFAPPP